MIFVPSLLLAASIVETTLTFPTYPFGDPDPVPHADSIIYPYFGFSETTLTSTNRVWKAVILENDQVKVTILPEVGGKVWGATDKKTGRDFIYYNHAVKFRNIAMRGPWCSGGVEFNFGVIGHAPWTACPVSYFTRTNADQSVSCFLSETEYVAGTTWQVEVNLPNDADGFKLRTIWFNGSGLPEPYYQWMNAAYSLKNNPEFIYPGTHEIEHTGEVHGWPIIDEAGHNVTNYWNNMFGGPKSWHVINGDNGKFGIWWPDGKGGGFGSAHINGPTDKYGRKLFLWALSRDGGIWEDLLTDTDGQYGELQSGRLFNQAKTESYLTPFKHRSFAPGLADTFEEQYVALRTPDFFNAARAETNFAPRPILAPTNFNWNTAYGHYLQGQQWVDLKYTAAGEKELLKALDIEPCFLPAIDTLALLAVGRADYAQAHEWAEQGLAIDTYDPAVNYADGLAYWAEGNRFAARERLGLAAYSVEYRAASFAAVARIDLAAGDYASAESMAQKALDADANNLDAHLVKLIAARKQGNMPRATALAQSILAKYPLFHAARYELNQLDPASTPWRTYLRNELPQETLLTLGTWYETSGLLNEAAQFFALAAEKTPIAQLRLAFLKHVQGDEAAAQKLLADAASRSIAFALPFRRESFPAINYAVAANTSWKFRYYQALMLIAHDHPVEGLAFLDACGNEPQDWIFYLVRANQRDDERALADLKRADALGGSWRIGYALYAWYGDHERWPEALAAVRRYHTSYDSNRLRLAFADCLVKNHLPDEAIEYLKTTSFTPSEGGEHAAASWVEAYRQLAQAAFDKGDKAQTRALVTAALSYPEALGRGRPFEIEDYEKWDVLEDWSPALKDLAHEIWRTLK